MTAGASSGDYRPSARPCSTPEQNPDFELVGPASVPAQGRALVRFAAAENVNTVNARPTAYFVAHLIATAAGAPQTRARRRAEPDWAKAIYAATGAPVAPAGRLCRRTA